MHATDREECALGETRHVKTVCPYCGVGCGIEASVRRGKVVAIRGDRSHPANFGKLCPKPAGLPEAVHHPERLTRPLRRSKNGGLRPVSWDTALDELSERLGETVKRHGPDAAALYISGQLLTEDYYAANKLWKGCLGTNNLDSNSRLCMSSAVAGYKGAFGSDGPPAAYADIGYAECIVLWGSNTAECHPVVFGRIRERRRDPKARVIVVDPRATATAELADLHLRIRPGTDLTLANAMLRILDEEGLIDCAFIRRRTAGFEETLTAARKWSPRQAARVCGIAPGEVLQAARMFGEASSALVFWTMGVNQSSVGTLKNRAIINLCLATGNVGKRGAGPFSLTGQPNAMGGRETGGLAHLLPGYRLVGDPGHRAEIEGAWGLAPGSISPDAGLPAVEMFKALEEGSVRLLWVAATNPAASMPDLARTKAALERAEFVVTQDIYQTETTQYADLVLPAAGWGEKEGVMTNSERRVSLVERMIEPPGEALADWKIFAAVAHRLGFGGAFAWESAEEVFDEYRELTRGRPCEITGLSYERLRRGPAQWPVYDALPYKERPAHWQTRREAEEEHPGTPRLYTDGRFETPDGRARFTPTPHSGLTEPVSEKYPLVLSTGRIKRQWHTMTRTGRSEKLMRGLNGPFVELHPVAARRHGLRAGERARIVSARGSFEAQVRLSPGIEEDTIFAPFHWGDLWTDNGSVNEATHGESCPVSRQPELKGAAVRVEPLRKRERSQAEAERSAT